jgi:hypothetical protein
MDSLASRLAALLWIVSDEDAIRAILSLLATTRLPDAADVAAVVRCLSDERPGVHLSAASALLRISPKLRRHLDTLLHLRDRTPDPDFCARLDRLIERYPSSRAARERKATPRSAPAQRQPPREEGGET